METLAWNGKRAVWSAVTGAKKYELQLYFNGTAEENKLGSEITVSGTSRDLSANFTTNGSYYYSVRAVSGDVTGEWSELSEPYVHDTLPPEITSRPPERLSAASAIFYFTSSEPGDYYFVLRTSGSSSPTTADEVINSPDVLHNACTAAEQPLTLKNIADAEAKDIYIVVVDAAKNKSAPYKIVIPAYVAPTPAPTPVPTRRPIVTATPEPAAYKVTLPTGTGYVVKAYGSSSSPVEAGGSYSFTLTIYNGYTKGSGFAVKANGKTLSASNNVYTITNITSDQTVTVSGVTALWSSGGSNTTTNTTNVPALPSITTTTLPAAEVGKQYSQQLAASGGTPITWSYTGSSTATWST